jgi:hypothetical protein
MVLKRSSVRILDSAELPNRARVSCERSQFYKDTQLNRAQALQLKKNLMELKR